MPRRLGFLLLLVCSACAGKPAEVHQEEATALTASKSQETYFVLLGSGEQLFVAQPPPRTGASSESGTMMYPADGGVGGFIASIFIHAAVQSGINKAKEDAFHKYSQKLLDPIREDLNSIDFPALKREVTHALSTDDPRIAFGEYAPGSFVLTLDPVFVLSYTSNAWGLATHARVFPSIQHALEESEAAYTRDIYVQSPASQTGTWTATELNDVFRNLLAISIPLSLDDYSGSLPIPAEEQTTVRYLSNGGKQVERGYLIQERDNSVLFRSLSGELKLMPSYSADD